MRYSVDGWDPSYGASLEREGALEGQLAESTARIDPDIEVPAGHWRPIDPDPSGPVPDALLFVDGVRRVEAQVWIDGEAPSPDTLTGEVGDPAGEPTAALCASYAAGVVCCCAAGALFSCGTAGCCALAPNTVPRTETATPLRRRARSKCLRDHTDKPNIRPSSILELF